MAHELDFSTGDAAFAYVGEKAWHGYGQQLEPGAAIEQWAQAARLDWTAHKLPLYFKAPTPTNPNALENCGDHYAIVRDDTLATLGIVKRQYQVVQPAEVLDFFNRFVSVDDRFALETAGALKGGAVIWALARFQEPQKVAGEAHDAYALLTTSFDGSSATLAQATVIRVVCNNTLTASLYDKSAVVRVTHRSRFDPDGVMKQLATVAQGFDTFKTMGDAMAQTSMAREDVSTFFKRVLDIPADAKREDIPTRTLNRWAALGGAYETSVNEGAPALTKWSALQAVTRYVDHERNTRGDDESKLYTANFGSGAAMKSKALGLLNAI